APTDPWTAAGRAGPGAAVGDPGDARLARRRVLRRALGGALGHRPGAGGGDRADRAGGPVLRRPRRPGQLPDQDRDAGAGERRAAPAAAGGRADRCPVGRAGEAQAAVRPGRVHRAAGHGHRPRPVDRLRVDGDDRRRAAGRGAGGRDRGGRQRPGRPREDGRGELVGDRAGRRPGVRGRRTAGRRQPARCRRRQRPGPADVHPARPEHPGPGRRPPGHRPVRRLDVRGRAAAGRGDRGVRRPGRAGPRGHRPAVRVLRVAGPGRRAAGRPPGRPAGQAAAGRAAGGVV
ncbi:MAG: Rod shape-determining protein MreC, partial [uncultured Corynebacteriales bacterium]